MHGTHIARGPSAWATCCLELHPHDTASRYTDREVDNGRGRRQMPITQTRLPVLLLISTWTSLSCPCVNVCFLNFHIPLQRASTVFSTLHCFCSPWKSTAYKNTFNLGVINGVGCLMILLNGLQTGRCKMSLTPPNINSDIRCIMYFIQYPPCLTGSLDGGVLEKLIHNLF